MKSQRRNHRRRAFTLMEVLLVLAILVILGSLVTVGYMQIQRNAYRDAARNQIKNIENAVMTYALAIGQCPNTEQGLEALRTAPSDLRNPRRWAGPYLGKANEQLPMDPWGNPYQYEATTTEDFKVWSMGPDGQTGTEDDVDPTLERQQGLEPT
jgi:general secretion pathway protein G